MSVTTTLRRLSLMAGTSLAAIGLGAAAFMSVALAPATASAANECGDPNSNGTDDDSFVCEGTYSAITYPEINGSLTLTLFNDVTATSGGLVIDATSGPVRDISIQRSDSPFNAGDPSLTNTSGPGMSVVNTTGGIAYVVLSDFTADSSDGPMRISGTTAGALVVGGGGFLYFANNTPGSIIEASDGNGYDLTLVGPGQIFGANSGQVTGSSYGLRAASTEPAIITLTNGGSITGGEGAIAISGASQFAIFSQGFITGSLAIEATDSALVDNYGTWSAFGTSDLGAGTSTLRNRNLLVVGGLAGDGDTLTLNSLEFWDNSGAVVFGGGEESLIDGVANDRIVANGTLFTGSGDSTLIMDVDFSADQADCSAAVTADCFDLRNSTTAGSTKIRVNAITSGMPTADRIVLVDVSGTGTSAAEHFVLDPLSSGYRELTNDGAVDQGMYFYGLNYDATAQQHYLAPVAFGSGVVEIPQIARAASEPWRTATGAWRERQRDMRAAWDDQRAAGPSFWLKGARNIIDDERRQTVTVGDLAFDDHIASHQNTDAVIGGLDLLHMVGNDSAFVAGVTAGKLKSNFDHKITGSELELDGHSFGAYATYMTGSLMADVIANATDLDLSRSQMDQRSEGSAKSIGVQAEGGWRLFQLDDGGGYIEPIAALSYVKTEVDDLTIGTTTATFADAKSLRGSVGARVGGKMDVGPVTLGLTATGQVWKEFEGENEATLRAVFGEETLTDAAPETLGEVGLALDVLSAGPITASFGYGIQLADDYRSSDAGLTVRVRW